MSTAAERARARVVGVRDDPEARLALMHRLYRGDDSTFLPYRRGAVAFTRWQVRRGLLRPPDDARAGSPWWRAVNERLLRDGWEARALDDGHDPAGGTASAVPTLEFIRHPTAPRWYRAHNVSIVTAFLEHRDLAEQESRTERFFINLVLLRVLYAHALVAAPRLALGRLAPIAPLLGDPRVRMTGLFLAISRVLPDTYPLGDDVERYVAVENPWGRMLDVGVIQPRLRALYDWSASELGAPALRDLLADGVPCYAWPADDRRPWFPPSTVLTRLARRVVPPRQVSTERRCGVDHVAFAVLTRAHLDTWASWLDPLGIEHSGITDATDPAPSSVLVFRDPDNVQLELFPMDQG